MREPPFTRLAEQLSAERAAPPAGEPKIAGARRSRLLITIAVAAAVVASYLLFALPRGPPAPPFEGYRLSRIVGVPSSDAYVYQFETDRNYGYRTIMGTRSGEDSNGRSFLKFGLGWVPVGAEVVSATLWLYHVYENEYVGAVPVRVCAIEDDTWHEHTVTWRDMPLELVWPADVEKTGTMTGVIDGDTILVNDNERYRLAGIDAPVLDWPGGPEAADYVRSKLPAGSAVGINIDNMNPEDPWGRSLAVIYYSDGQEWRNLNRELLQNGLAVKCLLPPSELEAQELTLDVVDLVETGWYSWDVTSFVASELAGDGVASLMLAAGAEDDNTPWTRCFYSKEAEGYEPYLEVRYVMAREPGFFLLPDDSSVAMRYGGDAQVPAEVLGIGGFSGTVSLSAASVPGGINVTFSPASHSVPFQFLIDVSASRDLPPGTYSFQMAGAGGGMTSTADLVLTILGGPTFGVLFDRAAADIAIGESGRAATATVSSIDGFSDSVTVSASVYGEGLDVTVSRSRGVPPFSVGVDVAAGTLARPGEYEITILASDGREVKHASLALNVTLPQLSQEDQRLLDFINHSTTTADVLVGADVYTTTAANIVAYRDGPDGVYGTGDDNLFYTVEELDGISGVGPVTIDRLRAYSETWVPLR